MASSWIEGVQRLADLLDVHRTLVEQTPDARGAGELHERQNWIGGNPYAPLDASFVPPPPEHVPGLVDDHRATSPNATEYWWRTRSSAA